MFVNNQGGEGEGEGRGVERWVGFLGLNRVVDGEDFSACLMVEESDVPTALEPSISPPFPSIPALFV